MKQFFHIFLLFYINYSNIKSIKINNNKDILNKLSKNIDPEKTEYNIELQKIQMERLNYEKTSRFKIVNNTPIDSDIFVIFSSINCEKTITIENNEKFLLNKTEDTYSFLLKQGISLNDTIFEVKFRTNQYNYNYNGKNCPVIINSGEYNYNKKINMNNNELTLFYFDEYLTEYNILYNLKNHDIEDRFVTFYFLFNRKTKFEINIYDKENNSNIISKTIQNSTNILLDNNKIKNNNTLIVSIKYNDSKSPILLLFKSIEKNSISILKKNYLNYGFITSNTSYQYYYIEVFKNEQGVIFLHNKRTNGKLYGLIIPRKNNNDEEITNDVNSYYPNNKYNKSNYLELNENTLKLKYNPDDTLECEEGCYLLITYYHENFVWHDIVGYEFTLLIKTSDTNDGSQKIINIPLNEYIFGYFEDGEVKENYYSIFMPNDAEEIIIQIEGNNIEGSMGGGKKKLSFINIMNNIKKLEIDSERNILRYKMKNLSNFNIYCNNYISLAFKPLNYLENHFSYYYFRIFYLKESEDLIYPLDSNMGNMCKPKYDNETSKFYCYFFLENKNNIFSLNYSISIANTNQKSNIYYLKKYDNTYQTPYPNEYNKSQNFLFDNENNVEFVIFKFEFNNNKIQKIFLTFSDIRKEIYPHIYFSQLYHLKGIQESELINSKEKIFKFSLTKDIFSVIFTLIYGSGTLTFNGSEITEIKFSQNFKDMPILYPLSNFESIKMNTTQNFLFKVKINNIKQNNGIRELTYGESMNEIINKLIPFYYIECNENIELNFRIINDDEIKAPSYNTTIFGIEGYKSDYEIIEKKKKGVFIDLVNPIIGDYDIVTKTGLLQVNKENNEIGNYLLIKIKKINQYLNSNINIQIISLNKDNNDYILPINQYITGRLKYNQEKIYSIQISEWDKINLDTILIEFSSNYDDLKLEILGGSNNITNNTENGIKKYRIINLKNDIKIKISNLNNIKDINYIIRYLGTVSEYEYKYKFNNKKYTIYKIKENSNQTVNFKFKFENIKINSMGKDVIREGIVFKIYSSLFLDEKIKNKELLDSIATLSSEPSFTNITLAKYEDNEFNIYFNNIERDYYNYILQIKVHVIIKDNFLNEDFLVYKMPIDLKKYLKKRNYSVIIIFISFLVIIITIIIVFCIIYNRLKKKNMDLKEKVLTTSFICRESEISQEENKDNDNNNEKDTKKENIFRTTFI